MFDYNCIYMYTMASITFIDLVYYGNIHLRLLNTLYELLNCKTVVTCVCQTFGPRRPGVRV